jgi:hypothetical protein
MSEYLSTSTHLKGKLYYSFDKRVEVLNFTNLLMQVLTTYPNGLPTVENTGLTKNLKQYQ